MLDFFLMAGMQPFTVAFVLLLAILVLEIIGALMGAPWSSAGGDTDVAVDLDVDAEIDIDVDADLDVDAGIEGDVDGAADGVGAVAGALSWLGLGRVPFLVLLAGFLAAFAITGTILQQVANAIAGPLPGWLAALIALPPTLFGTRWFSIGVSRILPKEETAAVSLDSLVGAVARVTVGTARSDLPAEARARDRLGHVHYIRVRPEDPSAAYPSGTRVVLVARDGTLFTAVPMQDRQSAIPSAGSPQ